MTPSRTRLVRTAVALVLGVLAGCGGSFVDTDIDFDWNFGSIALNSATLEAAITARYPSQEEADAAAIRTCGGAGCTTVLRFAGAGSCGALARSTNRVIGLGTGASLDAARTQALEQCRAQGGVDCTPGLSACND